MKPRRPLIEALNAIPVERTVEEEFVFAAKQKPADNVSPSLPIPTAEAREGTVQSSKSTSREPLTTRIRSDFAKALKRASLERQLSGEFPNTILEILEEALEPWLRTHGYLEAKREGQ